MTKSVLFLFALFTCLPLMAQDAAVSPENEVYNISGLQVKPEYPGGMQAFYQYVSRSFRVPELDNEEDISAKIFMSFVIEKDGSISNVKVLRDPGYGLGNEAARILKLSEKWTPGMQNGKVVRTSYSLPISINIEGTPKEKGEINEAEENEPVKVEAKPKVTKVATKNKQATTKKKKA